MWFTDPIYGFLRKAADSFGPRLPLGSEPDDDDHNPCDLPYLDDCAKAQGANHKGVYRWKDGDPQLCCRVSLAKTVLLPQLMSYLICLLKLWQGCLLLTCIVPRLCTQVYEP